MKDFERQGYRWLELCREFIKEANQAEIVASGENLEEKRDFLRKVGSNPTLHARTLALTPAAPWSILADSPRHVAQGATDFDFRTSWLPD